MANYFQFYDIPQSFKVDDSQVKRKFYELSKQYHPDFYINEPTEKQQEILELSTQNNNAYQVLSNPAKRMEHMLEIHQLIVEGEKYKLPQIFLMEMMDVNEALMELEFEPDPAAIQKINMDVDSIEHSLSDNLNGLTSKFDASNGADKKAMLLEIKDLYYRQKYMLRIRDSLNKFASR